MSLIDYIKGNRKGREAHNLEKEALDDQFLYEAMQGYDSVNDEDHAAIINKLQKTIRSGRKLKKSSDSGFSFRKIAAAAILLIFGLGGYLLIDELRDGIANLSAKAKEKAPEIIDIYVPENFYSKNVKVIEKKNKNVIQKFSNEIDPFSVPDVTATVTQEEMNELSEPKRAIIDIYIPDAAYELHEPIIERGNSIAKEIMDTTRGRPLKIYIPEKDYHRFKNKIEQKD